MTATEAMCDYRGGLRQQKASQEAL